MIKRKGRREYHSKYINHREILNRVKNLNNNKNMRINQQDNGIV